MRRIDRYQLERPLGRGTFGTTHLAHDRERGRAVAIKCLPLASLSEWKPVELFEREARVLESLDHPGVPAYIEAFEDGDGDDASGHRFYIVCEYFEGPTLQAEIERGRRFRPAQARALFGALLRILDYLHSLSPRVVHRDIKPANVILRAGDEPGLVDFGSVRDVAARAAGGGMTIAGTAGYMAPEQAMGIADARSDLYGLAATMAHALTHVHPSELPREGLRPNLSDLSGVDAQLARLLERLLDPDPGNRLGSAAEVLAALEETRAPAERPRALAARADEAALARRDPEAALLRLTAGARVLTPEVTSRLGYTRAFRSSRAVGLGALLGSIGLGFVFGVANFPSVALFFILTSVIGLFLAPLPYLRRQRALYERGAVALGAIAQARNENGALVVKYTFRHRDGEYGGTLVTSDPFIANRVEPDTPVYVFFNPERPQQNTALLADELPPALRAGDA
ncbi:MAG: serine/threonine-protein kinase [Nannocystaceae bacterium]